MSHADPPWPPSADVGRIRVATVPHRDPYVDAVLPDGAVHVGPPDEPSPWLDIDHLTRHARKLDVLHVHAGAGRLPPGDLEGWAEAVRRLGIPLVVTVHRLPGHSDAQVRPLLGTAEVVLTLTAGAAEEIFTRFGRTAIVVAHPSLTVPDPDLGAERGLVGLRLGSPSMGGPDQPELVRSAVSGAVSGGGRLRLLVTDASVPVPAVRARAERGELEIVVHAPEEIAAQLQRLHVAVLPEPCGTHSRHLEVCRDVGTRVVAPSCGWSADQWSEVVTYSHDERSGLDGVSLTAAVAAALTRPMPRPADRTWRDGQRAAVREVHAEVYAQVAADRSPV